MNKLDQLLNKIEGKIPFFETNNQAVSKSNIGWQIEHIFMTLNVIIDALAKSDPKCYKWTFSFFRTIILTTKIIPRGRAKAPDVVQPAGHINTETLMTQLSETSEKIKVLNTLNKSNYFEHPYFGKLNSRQTVNFLEIHTKHHLKIIDDILKKTVLFHI